MKLALLASAFLSTALVLGRGYVPDKPIEITFDVQVEHVRQAVMATKTKSHEFIKTSNYRNEMKQTTTNVAASVAIPLKATVSASLGVSKLRSVETKVENERLLIQEEEITHQPGKNQILRIVTITTTINRQSMVEIERQYVDVDTDQSFTALNPNDTNDLRKRSIQYLNDIYVTHGPKATTPRQTFSLQVAGCRSRKHILDDDVCYTTVSFDAFASNLGRRYDRHGSRRPESYLEVRANNQFVGWTDPQRRGGRPDGNYDPSASGDIDLDLNNVQNFIDIKWWDDDDGDRDLMCSTRVSIRDVIEELSNGRSGSRVSNSELGSSFGCLKGGTAGISFYLKWSGEDCSGISENDFLTQGQASIIANSHGLKLGGNGYAFAGNYGTKGLYYYKSGRYAGMAFFGLGGSRSDQKAGVSGGKFRLPQRCR